MKKSLLFGALASCASMAHAQSSVTLYGIIDEGLMFVNNVGGQGGGHRYTLDATNGIQGTRYGLTGSEDLGGGLKAIFTLESGVNLNNGAFAQGGTSFGRQAFVGLSSNTAGSLTFGRQYDAIVYFAQPVTSEGPVAGSTAFEHPGDLDNTGMTVRVNNAIRYMSPNYHGFTYGAEYSVGGTPGNFTSGSGYSIGTAYASGPLTLGAAFEFFKNPTGSAGTGFFTGNANGVSPLANALNKGYASATSYQVAVAGAGYVFGPVLVTSSYSNIQYGGLGAGFAGASAHFNNADFAMRYTYSPSLLLSIAYDYLKGEKVKKADGSSVGDQHFNQVSLMADYFLSKTTDVYIQGAYQRAVGTSSTGGEAVADIGNLGDSSNRSQVVARVALRTKF
jgi:predicted porin